MNMIMTRQSHPVSRHNMYRRSHLTDSFMLGWNGGAVFATPGMGLCGAVFASSITAEHTPIHGQKGRNGRLGLSYSQ